MKKTLFRIGLALSAVPMVAAAQVTGPTAAGGNYVGTVQSPRTILQNVTNTLASLFLFAAVIYLILAGYQYLTAGGDTEKFDKAKRNFMYAIVGIAVGLLAYALPGLVSQFLTQGGALQ